MFNEVYINNRNKKDQRSPEERKKLSKEKQSSAKIFPGVRAQRSVPRGRGDGPTGQAGLQTGEEGWQKPFKSDVSSTEVEYLNEVSFFLKREGLGIWIAQRQVLCIKVFRNSLILPPPPQLPEMMHEFVF